MSPHRFPFGYNQILDYVADRTPSLACFSQAALGTYNGVETALSFGDPAAELAALRSGCGVFSLAWRGKINVTGKDRVRWLHNMVTNTVRDLPVNRGKYNFVLNAQGRILGDMYIFNRGESLIMDTDASQVETLLTRHEAFHHHGQS